MTRVDLAAYEAGSTEPWTVDILCALIYAKRPRVILELGTFEGKGTRELALAAPQAQIITVEYDAERYAAARAALADLPNVHCVHDDAIHFLRSCDDIRFDFVFVDDDHDATHVAEELRLLHSWQGPSLMSPGGLIACHDVIGRFNLGPVVVGHHGFVLELPLLHAAGGLGLIQIPGPMRNMAGQHVILVEL